MSWSKHAKNCCQSLIRESLQLHKKYLKREESSLNNTAEKLTKKYNKSTISLRIWYPSLRTESKIAQYKRFKSLSSNQMISIIKTAIFSARISKGNFSNRLKVRSKTSKTEHTTDPKRLVYKRMYFSRNQLTNYFIWTISPSSDWDFLLILWAW